MSKKEKLQLQVLTAVVAGVVSVSIGGGTLQRRPGC